MLTIRPSQFNDLTRLVFEDWLARTLRAQYPELAQMPAPELQSRISRDIAEARRLGWSDQRDVAFFALARFGFGGDNLANSPDLAWFQAILDDAAIADPQQRIAALRAATYAFMDGESPLEWT